MKKMLKKCLTLIISSGMILSLAACSSGSSNTPKETEAAAETVPCP